MIQEEQSSIIRGVLADELSRNERMKNRYLEELDTLPKGSLMLRRIGKQEYYYLKYRESKKVISKYLGKNGEIDVDPIKERISKRKHIENIIKNLKAEEKEIKRTIR